MINAVRVASCVWVSLDVFLVAGSGIPVSASRRRFTEGNVTRRRCMGGDAHEFVALAGLGCELVKGV